MVPDHPLHQLKPKSGARVGTGLPQPTRRFRYTKSALEPWHAQHEADALGGYARDMWLRDVRALFQPSVVEQPREERAHVVRRVEVPVDTHGAAADREGKPVHVGHDREHGLVGDVVADEDRTASLERLVLHQLAHAGRLGETGMLDLANELAGQHL